MEIRKATVDDVPILARHHRQMMADIWEQKGDRLEDGCAEALEFAYRQKAEIQIPDGTCCAWVIEEEGQIIASGALSIVSLTPVPSDLNPMVAYLHSIYTDKAHRRQQCARIIVERAIDCCRRAGIRRIILNTSAAGRALYEQSGFVSAPESMRLLIE